MELQRSHTDLLFFLFYAGHGDRLQLTAASLLFERGWRFNIPNQVLEAISFLIFLDFLALTGIVTIDSYFLCLKGVAGKMAWHHAD